MRWIRLVRTWGVTLWLYCRYYLLVAPGVQELLSTWGIGAAGPTAYRPQFCTRRLVTQFSYVSVVLRRTTTCSSRLNRVGLDHQHACGYFPTPCCEAGYDAQSHGQAR